MGRTLTARQQRVYDFIHDKISNRGYGPTVREIGEFLGIKSPNGVICHLRALERKGMIARTANKSRSIELRNRPHALNSTTLSMRGQIDSDSCNFFDAPQTLDFLNALQHPGRFLLRYNGDDLRHWAILDGDILVVEQNAAGSPGQIELVRDASGKSLLRPWRSHEEPTAKERMAAGHTAVEPSDREPAADEDASQETTRQGQVVGIIVGVLRALPGTGDNREQPLRSAQGDRSVRIHLPHANGPMHSASKPHGVSSSTTPAAGIVPRDLPQPAGAR